MVERIGLNYKVIDLRNRGEVKTFLSNKQLITQIKSILEENNALVPREKHKDGKINSQIYSLFKRYVDIFFLAYSEKTGELVGVIDGEIHPTINIDKNEFNIHWIAVKKEYQNRNIGKRSMLRLCEYLIKNDFSEITLYSISVKTDKILKFLDGKESSLGKYKEDKEMVHLENILYDGKSSKYKRLYLNKKVK
ncbi:MAG: GNAT family N-acetyltransferase [archaeon]|jgi:ribosomal protein S18 acetylase RimI-like enzyme